MTQIQPLSFPVAQHAQVPAWLAAGQRISVQAAFTPRRRQHATEHGALDSAGLEQQLAELRAQAEAEGRARGEAAAQAAFAPLYERLELLLAELVDMRSRLLTMIQPQIAELALCVAETILMREVRTDPDDLMRLVGEAVALVAAEDQIEITVSPLDYQEVIDRLTMITQGNPRAQTLQVKADDTIQAGCVVETRLARVDATVTTRLRNIAESLKAQEA